MDRSLQKNPIYQAPIAIAYLDTDLKYVAHSKKWCTDYGLECLDLVGKHHYDVFPAVEAAYGEQHQRILKEGLEESHDAEKFVREDGTVHWLKWSHGPTRDENNTITGIVMMTEDVSESINKRSKLDREHQLLLDAANKAKIGSWEMNHLTNELYWSRVTKKIHQVSEDFIPDVATGINFYKPGVNQEIVTDLFTRSYETGERLEAELQIITAKGKERWVRSVMKAEIVDGRCIRQYGTFEDITEKVESEMNYKLALRKFHDVFEASGIGKIVVDPIDLSITEVNPKMCELLNYEASHVKTSSLEKYVLKSDFPRLFNAVTDLLNKKIEGIDITINLKKSTGRFIICSVIGTLIEDDNGDPVDLVIQVIDISAIKKKEDEVNAFTKYVEQQNERLLNFAHIVSHNLRSHSSNFEVLLNLYKQETEVEDQQNIIKLLSSSSSQLAETIGHLNDVVAVNTQKIELTNIYLKENIFKVMENISSQIKEYHINVHVEIDDDFTVAASPAYLESILLNLLTNSIKYRKKEEPTKITIKAFKHEGKSRIIFEDNGIGIDMKLNGHKIFGMYKTFHGNKDARGIGLYMTKNQVEAMGGTIRVESEKNVGTKFKITL
ncbi:PAS domain S-box-containing protein [Nonlabens sp. Hel1_33_55]|uniref:PAS domain-containing sensor histidine kinase n=1 Tax=Nonlabens sp. Hel1_33_55 TaxID=1336802 RepID=UPI000875C011|nr:PAS domain-containing sensor histidine kinase [Nonlabens sp. Hel1_33_55]SCY29772.1 PAS domain S-box-containing protein [Nonlabens sp. Hel1_33_55]